MSGLIANLFSWTFAGGLLLGFLGSRLWALIKVCWADRRRPLPDGKRRDKWAAVAVDPRWIAGLIAVAVAGWSVFQTSSNADHARQITEDARAFAEETRNCQKILIDAIEARARISAENDRLSRIQRDALANWLRVLLNPPPEIARLPQDAPERQNWAIGATSATFRIIADAQRQQEVNEAERRAHPLPAPSCS